MVLLKYKLKKKMGVLECAEDIVFVDTENKTVEFANKPLGGDDKCKFIIIGIQSCRYYVDAVAVADELINKKIISAYVKKPYSDWGVYKKKCKQMALLMKSMGQTHESSPFIMMLCETDSEKPVYKLSYIGGYGEFKEYSEGLVKKIPSSPTYQVKNSEVDKSSFSSDVYVIGDSD